MPAYSPTFTGRDNLLAGLRGSLQAALSTVVQARHGCASLASMNQLAVTALRPSRLHNAVVTQRGTARID